MENKEATNAQKTALLLHLFGDLGETMQLLAPGGWMDSPLLRLHHPTAEQGYEAFVSAWSTFEREGLAFLWLIPAFVSAWSTFECSKHFPIGTSGAGPHEF